MYELHTAPRPRASRNRTPGYRAVVSAVRGCEFPCASEDLVLQLDDPRVEVAPGQFVELSRILANLPQYRFDTPRQFSTAVRHQWARIRNLLLPAEQGPAGGRPIQGGRVKPRRTTGTKKRRKQKKRAPTAGRRRAIGARDRARQPRHGFRRELSRKLQRSRLPRLS